MPLRMLFIGDIVGAPGRALVAKLLPGLRREWQLDLVVANAENAAGGSGLTAKSYREMSAAGVDLMTMGDHVYRKSQILDLFNRHTNICRPANFPASAPGPAWVEATTADGTRVAAFVLLGRLFMKPVDCPFQAADRVLSEIRSSGISCILADMHAEATAEKQLAGRFLAGRVSAVLGTHTHVPTADEQILPGGTAYQTDVGMTGPYESIVGRRIDRVLHTTLTFEPSPFDVATGDVRLAGALLEIDPSTGRAASIRRVLLSRAPEDDR